jgi:hypothetical protein
MPTTTVEVEVEGRRLSITAAAFVAVASKCSAQAEECEMSDAVNNNCDSQRRHLDEDIALWYQAFEPSMYNQAVQFAFAALVRRIGTGPWGAGVWYGDSQQYFLTVWLATSLLSGLPRILLDYYVYDHFCENPGNQCFVLGADSCAACIERSAVFGQPVRKSRCGSQSVHSVVSSFKGRRAQDLYDKLLGIAGPPDQVFDVLFPTDHTAISMLPAPSPEPVPAPPPAALRREELVDSTMFGRFKFVGFGARTAAPALCGGGQWHMVRPKRAEDLEALQAAVDSAVQVGTLSIKWPRNRLWLGGTWNSSAQRWQWDDGDPISGDMDWEIGEPSGADAGQGTEPLLYLSTSSGKLHDHDDPRDVCGIMCEEGAPA